MTSRSFATALLLVLTACAHGQAEPARTTPRPPPGDSVRVFFPLSEGNTWRYADPKLGEQEVRIVGRDGRWWVDSTGERWTIDAEGLRTGSRYLIKAPVNEGTEWASVVSISSTEHYEIVETGARTVVPAGTFDACIRVLSRNRHSDTATLFMQYTFCPRVGLVRMRSWADVAGKGQIPQADVRLISYELGEGAG